MRRAFHLPGGPLARRLCWLRCRQTLPPRTSPHLLQAVSALHRGEAGAAAGAAAAALREQPDLPAARFWLAEALRLQGRFSEALPHLATVLDHCPHWAGAWESRALCSLALDRAEDALHCFGAALAARPGDAALWNNLALCLDRLGRTAAAVDGFRRALRLGGRDAFVLGNLGAALQKAGRAQEAVRCLHQACRRFPADAVLQHNLGRVLLSLQRNAEAEATFRRALELDAGSRASGDGLIVSLVRQGKAEAAAALAASDPARQAFCLLEAGRVEEALLCFDAALAAEPENGMLVAGKATCLFRQGRFLRALALFRRAAALEPGRRSHRLAQGACLERLGKVEEALTLYNAALTPDGRPPHSVEPKGACVIEDRH